MLGVFYKEKEEYTDRLDVVGGYIKQLANYISVTKSIPIERATEVAKDLTRKHFKDKEIKYFERGENGDRRVERSSLLGYIKRAADEANIITPTFTTYLNNSVKKSVLSNFIFTITKKRSIAKKLSHKYRAEGKLDLAGDKNREQALLKIYANSLSGIFAQKASILYNPTAHSTLTSLTRTITSLSNANNEKLLTGNRYYPRQIDVLNDIVYLSTYADKEAITRTIHEYNLYMPTVEDTIEVLKRSTDLYFSDKLWYETKIYSYLSKLEPYQLASICYTNDLYHIRKFNEGFTRELIGRLISPVYTPDETLEDPNIIYKIDESIVCFVHHIVYYKIQGYGKNYEEMNKHGLASSIYNTCYKVIEVFGIYKNFFSTFFMSGMFPCNSYRLQNMRRRTVVLSNTDSTCFTLDEWVTWYKGKFVVDGDSIALGGCLSYIASQCIVHLLAILSKRMGVATEYLNKLAMKNEFLWVIHAPAEVNNHYYGYTYMQEGNAFTTPDIEKKGVHLKNSSVPSNVIEDADQLIEHILNSTANNKSINLQSIVTRIINLEKGIESSVRRGESLYLKKSKVNLPEAYVQGPDKSPYQRHTFWMDVFSHKYGEVQEPPYDVVKIPTTLTTKTALTNWINSIQDIHLRERLIDWLARHGKSDLPTIYLNEIYVKGYGIPEEIQAITNIKRIILDVSLQHCIILETLGVMLDKELLVQEQFRM